MWRAVLSLACAASAACAGLADAREWRLRSPGGRIEIEVRTTDTGGLQYRALRAASPNFTAVDWSDLGIVTQVNREFDMRRTSIADFTRGLTFESEERGQGEEAYHMATGKRLANRAEYRSLSLLFHASVGAGRQLRLDLRAYDEGAAFRYALPETDLQHHRLVEERTRFNIGTHATHWGQAYDFYTMYHPSYETFYTRQPSGSPTPPNEGTGWGFPSLFQADGGYVLIHEAGLDPSFQGSHLAAAAPNGVYAIAPPMAEEAQGFGANYPVSTLPWVMPWRVMIISDDLAGISESNLVFHLAHPSRVADASWVRPGPAAWNWLADHDSSRDPVKLRATIDLAAQMGWPYALMDANWNLSGADPLTELTAYARRRGVGLLFWYNSGGRHNVVTEQPRNIMDDRTRRRGEFARLQALGVRGVKIDFLQSDKQDMIKLYWDILEDAAAFNLMVDFHGSTIPRGWERTWPNLISMEAVRGAEFYTFSGEQNYGPRAPAQNAIHPFVRNVVGSMDYTPTHFSQFAVPRLTTNAHEAALAVLFESGIQHLSDAPRAYLGLPAAWRSYLSGLPTAWDDTRMLSGALGQYAVLARRSGRRWYVVGVNGEDVYRGLSLDLSLLETPGRGATLLFDDPGGGFGTEQFRRSGDRFEHRLSPYGGFVLILDEG